jgi:hypothetical protein
MIESIVLENLSIGTSLPININNREYVLDSVDFGTIQSSRNTYKYINQVGVYVTGTTLESRTINIIGWVVADSQADMTRRKNFLNRFVNPLQQLRLHYEEYQIDGIPTKTISYGTDISTNNEVLCKFMISLFCPDPLFHTENGTNVLIADWLPKFHFPLIIPKNKGIIMGLRSPASIATLNNDGSMPCGFVVTFEASGTVKNPYILNILTQEKIRLVETMEAGETLRVSTVPNNKTVKKISNGVETNAFNLLDLSSTFFSLPVGETYIRYGAEEGVVNLSVNVYYDTGYLEVQK